MRQEELNQVWLRGLIVKMAGKRSGEYAKLVEIARDLGKSVSDSPKIVASFDGLRSREHAEFLTQPEMQEQFGYVPAGRYGRGICGG